MKQIYFCIVCLIINLTAFSQKKIYLDRLECMSSNSRVFQYFNDKSFSKLIFKNWNQHLQAYQKYSLNTDTLGDISIIYNGFEKIFSKDINTKIKFTNISSSHLFVSLKEFRVNDFANIESKKKDFEGANGIIRSIIEVRMVIKNEFDIVEIDRTTNFIIYINSLNSIGFVNYSFSLAPSSFEECMSVASSKILNVNETIENSYTFLGFNAHNLDNCISTYVVGKDRIFTVINNEFAEYAFQDSINKMIRIAEPNKYLMDLSKKGLNRNKIEVKAALEHKKKYDNYSYISIEQSLRNVTNNINYSVINYGAIFEGLNFDALGHINYLPGKINYLLKELDTIANYTIERALSTSICKVETSYFYDGIDTSKKVIINEKQNLNLAEVYNEAKKIDRSIGSLRSDYLSLLMDNFLIEGELKKNSFKIEVFMSTGIPIRKIYFKDNLVIIAKGINLPVSFVILNPNLPPETFEELLLLSFMKLQ